jgi:hypothetical protein
MTGLTPISITSLLVPSVEKFSENALNPSSCHLSTFSKLGRFERLSPEKLGLQISNKWFRINVKGSWLPWLRVKQAL